MNHPYSDGSLVGVVVAEALVTVSSEELSLKELNELHDLVFWNLFFNGRSDDDKSFLRSSKPRLRLGLPGITLFPGMPATMLIQLVLVANLKVCGTKYYRLGATSLYGSHHKFFFRKNAK